MTDALPPIHDVVIAALEARGWRTVAGIWVHDQREVHALSFWGAANLQHGWDVANARDAVKAN